MYQLNFSDEPTQLEILISKAISDFYNYIIIDNLGNFTQRFILTIYLKYVQFFHYKGNLHQFLIYLLR